MAKAMLIMDMPECCAECKLYVKGKYRTDKCRITMLEMNNKFGKPSWCPLQEVPEKDNKCYFPDEYQEGYSNDWNACIRKILAGEGEDS